HAGIRGFDMHRAARLDLELRHRAGEARMRVQHAAALRGGEVDEVDLYIRPLQFGPGTGEGCCISRTHGERPALLHEILQPDLRLTEKTRHVVVQGDRLVAPPE